MIILLEINVEGFLWKCVEKASIKGHNHKVKQLPISERLDIFNKRKSFKCNLN